MASPEHALFSITDALPAWPAAPDQMTVTTLAEIEACPRRWALEAAEYSRLWTELGYPPRVQLTALAGTVVHLVLESILKALVRAGCSSVSDPNAAHVMRDLGGYTKTINECIERVLERLASNPRATRLLDYAARSLRAKVPEFRTRVQTMLCRLCLPNVMVSDVHRQPRRSRGPLVAGVFAEIELRATQIHWKGKADLLVLSPETCQIVDFKSGLPDERHRLQAKVYALLWSRDAELNPTARRVDRLRLAYVSGEVEVPAPAESELDELERHIIARAEAARRAVSHHPPEARPDAEQCRYCGVRQLCSEYWTARTQQAMATQTSEWRFGDLEVTITGRHGPVSWDAVVELSQRLPRGKSVVLRNVGDVQFHRGDKIRVLDATITADEEEETEPGIVTLVTLSETYVVARASC